MNYTYEEYQKKFFPGSIEKKSETPEEFVERVLEELKERLDSFMKETLTLDK